MGSLIRKIKLSYMFIHAFLILYSVLSVLPFVYITLGSVKTNKEILSYSFGLPEKFIFSNFADAWRAVNIGILLKNSFVISCICVVITIILAIMLAYVIARLNVRFNKIILLFYLFGIMVPIPALMLPSYLIAKWTGTTNMLVSLLGPYIALGMPISIYIIVSFIRNTPKDMEESAIIDGCGIFGVILKVLVPVLKPALATCAILAFLNNWNEFSLAVVLISKASLRTLPVGMSSFNGMHSVNYAKMMAAMVIALAPVILVYSFLQENIIKGMTEGAVKG